MKLKYSNSKFPKVLKLRCILSFGCKPLLHNPWGGFLAEKRPNFQSKHT